MGERNAHWPLVLAMVAASARTDGGVGLERLLEDAGLKEPPAMKIIVTRETIVRRSLSRDPG